MIKEAVSIRRIFPTAGGRLTSHSADTLKQLIRKAQKHGALEQIIEEARQAGLPPFPRQMVPPPSSAVRRQRRPSQEGTQLQHPFCLLCVQTNTRCVLPVFNWLRAIPEPRRSPSAISLRPMHHSWFRMCPLPSLLLGFLASQFSDWLLVYEIGEKTV